MIPLPPPPQFKHDFVRETKGVYRFECDLFAQARVLFADCKSNLDVAKKLTCSPARGDLPLIPPYRGYATPPKEMEGWSPHTNRSTAERLCVEFKHRAVGIGFVDSLNNYLRRKHQALSRALEF